MFRNLGVFHSDINAYNVLVSPPEALTRAVLIDFGSAEWELEEEWIINVEFFDDEVVEAGRGKERYNEVQRIKIYSGMYDRFEVDLGKCRHSEEQLRNVPPSFSAIFH